MPDNTEVGKDRGAPRLAHPVHEGRDRNGRLLPGHSGNPAGRPRKQAEAPMSLAQTLSEMLDEKVLVEGANGKKRWISRRRSLVEKILADLEKASPRELLALMSKLEALDEKGTPISIILSPDDMRL